MTQFLHDISCNEPFHVMEPEDWFGKAHTSDGFFVWAPPPAIADVVCYQLAEAIHVRPWNTHVVVIPSLMTARWRKMLGKMSDIMISLPMGEDLWPAKEHEYLTLAISFPLLSRNPWRVKRSDLRTQRELKLRQMRRESVSYVRDYMRQFWIQARSLGAAQNGVARAVL